MLNDADDWKGVLKLIVYDDAWRCASVMERLMVYQTNLIPKFM